MIWIYDKNIVFYVVVFLKSSGKRTNAAISCSHSLLVKVWKISITDPALFLSVLVQTRDLPGYKTRSCSVLLQWWRRLGGGCPLHLHISVHLDYPVGSPWAAASWLLLRSPPHSPRPAATLIFDSCARRLPPLNKLGPKSSSVCDQSVFVRANEARHQSQGDNRSTAQEHNLMRACWRGLSRRQSAQ